MPDAEDQTGSLINPCEVFGVVFIFVLGFVLAMLWTTGRATYHGVNVDQ